MHLAQELLTNMQCSGDSRNFAKEMRPLKLRSIVTVHRKFTTTNWEHHWNRSSYNYRKSCWRIQHPPLYSCLTFETNWKDEKLNEWVPHELTGNQKFTIFKVSSSLILYNNYEPFVNWIVMCDEKWILYDNQWWPAQWLDWEDAQSTPQSQTYARERSWSLFGGLLPI